MTSYSVKGKDGKEVELDIPTAFISGVADHLPFASELLNQAINLGSKGSKIDKGGSDAIMAAVAGIAPQDTVETMLALQMTAVHNATLTFARRLAHVDTIQQQDSAARAFNQLARTFATQVEALKRYRTGGEQKVTVQHVTVNEGGQAIVGN
ncbi:MAG TPA: hypothetical protein VGN97_21800, partial [Mesorhizobium sp.]|nr:hypothetical protein [Mesorhizobium sp.]